MSKSIDLSSSTWLTISCGAVEAICSVDGYVDGHHEADSTPEAGDDDKTAEQALLARLLLFVGLVDSSRETEGSEGI